MNGIFIFRFWCQDYEEQLSEIIGNLLASKYQNNSPNKRKRTLKNNSTQNNNSPTSDQVIITEGLAIIIIRLMTFFSQLLCHLEHFRRSCRHGNGTGTGLYLHDPMQRALQQSFSNSNDSTKVYTFKQSTERNSF